MTLVEFLALLPGTGWRDRALAVIYWHGHYKGSAGLTSAEVKSALIAARVRNAKQANIADVMNKAVPWSTWSVTRQPDINSGR